MIEMFDEDSSYLESHGKNSDKFKFDDFHKSELIDNLPDGELDGLLDGLSARVSGAVRSLLIFLFSREGTN